MKILVNGAGGMLGYDLVDALKGAGHSVRAFDHGGWDIADTNDSARILGEAQADWVIHCAAFTRVDDCETQRDKAFAINARAAGVVAAACFRAATRMIFLSTDYVFDGRATTPYRETDPPAPQGVYAQSKRAGEEAVLDALGGKARILRTSWLFGGHGANFVDTILRKAWAGDTLRVVNDQTGRPTFTVDLAEAIAALLSTPAFVEDAFCAAPSGPFLHLANEGACTWFEFSKAILETSGRGGQVPISAITTAELNRPAPRPAYSVLDTSRAAALGVTLRPWRDALRAYL